MSASVHDDQRFVRDQYATTAGLAARVNFHVRYSERQDSFAEWLLPMVGAGRGDLLIDVGCGTGMYHPALAAAGVRIVACDLSAAMAAHVRDGVPDAQALQASATALPFEDARFERAMANHMLYHVPDRPQALRELRRVVRRGGRVACATNAADNCAALYALHRRAATSCGYTTTPMPALRFTLDDLPLVQSVFPQAEMHVRRDAFRFPDVASALGYYGSYMVDDIADRPADGSHRARLLAAMTPLLQDVLAAHGVIRIPKDAGCFIAEV